MSYITNPLAIENANLPIPFESGLEYSAPARGGWTIVHVGMLVPEAHEIFICAAGCLRGVVLSAAEMNILTRFSTVAIEEQNVLNGDMESLIIDGVADIIRRLHNRPKVILVYLSCIHLFMGTDLKMCFKILRERYPDIDFMDCYMNPTMRKSGISPDQNIRRQIYELLPELPKRKRHVAIVGNCFAMGNDSDIARLINESGWTLHQITDYQNYENYKTMSQSEFCISTQPVAKFGADALARRLNIRHLYLPLSFTSDSIRRNMEVLASALGVVYLSEKDEKKAELQLEKAHILIGKTPIFIDYTFASCPLSIARLLLSYGFNVKGIFADSFSEQEREDYKYIMQICPDLLVYPTVSANMIRFNVNINGKILALGQKAAYYTQTQHFVNLVEGGGLYGFGGIYRLAEMMIDAYKNPKDIRKTISLKGLGCDSCI